MNDPMTAADYQSRTWERFEHVLRQRLAAQREINDARMDLEKTSHVRGRIAELKELLALAQPAQAPANGERGSTSSFDAFPRS